MTRPVSASYAAASVLAALALTGVLGSGLAAGAPPASPAPPKTDAGLPRIELSTTSPTARDQWADAVRSLSQCRAAEILVWYGMGSAFVHTPVAKPEGCAIDLSMEVEGAGWHLVCSLPKGKTWTWNLIEDDHGPLSLPPRHPPPDLAPFCRETK